MKMFTCQNPNCDGKSGHCARGLCYKCYGSKRSAVSRGSDSWESTKFRIPGRFGRPTQTCATTPECRNLALIFDEDGKYMKINGKTICLECYEKEKNQ